MIRQVLKHLFTLNTDQNYINKIKLLEFFLSTHTSTCSTAMEQVYNGCIKLSRTPLIMGG